jgi:DNA-binding NarL/FixJ family response regulator
MTASSYTLVIVDDEGAMTDGVANTIKYEPDLDCVGVARTAEEAKSLVAEHRPNLLLVDAVRFNTHWPVGDPRHTKPLALAAELKDLSPQSWMFLWTSWQDRDPSQRGRLRLVMGASRAGAVALLSKQDNLNEILNQLRHTAARGDADPRDKYLEVEGGLFNTLGELLDDLLPSEEDLAALDHPEYTALTTVERQRAPIFARAFYEGVTQKEIAANLFVTPGVIKDNFNNIKAKWDVESLPQFVDKARTLGIFLDLD